MRRSRLALPGVVSVALAIGAASGAAAQAEEDAAAEAEAPIVVSGTLDCEAESDDPEIGESVVNVHAWEASDARLSGEVEYTGRWQLYEEPSEDRGTVDDAGTTSLYEIVNEGGGWLCEASRVAEPRIAGTSHTLVFSGVEGYEGLTAYLHVDWTTTPYEFTGLILSEDAPEYAPPAE